MILGVKYLHLFEQNPNYRIIQLALSKVIQPVVILASNMTAALVDSNCQSALNEAPSRQVPAWKRLGLRLKFAKENTDQHTQLRGGTRTNNKRPHSEDAQFPPERAASEYDSKKRPRLHSPKPQSDNPCGMFDKVLIPSLRKDTTGIRKTVSFTSDTKIADGDSSKCLIAEWEAQYDQPSLAAKVPKDLQPSKEKAARSEKSRYVSTRAKPPAVLEYLTQFCQSRKTWKFNKNKETWIFKHLFSFGDIPSDYDIHLSHYLQGLRSASARSRLQEVADAVIWKDHQQQLEYTIPSESDGGAKKDGALDDMEDPERRRAYYEDSIRRYKRKLEQHLDEVAVEELNWISPERLANRRRAEMTLWAIGVSPSSAESTRSSDTTIFKSTSSRSDGSAVVPESQVTIPKRKRKNRTSIVELSGSSSDSSDSGERREQGEGADESDSDTSNPSATTKSTDTRIQSSASTDTQLETSSDEDTESTTSSSSGGFDGS